MNPRPTPSPPIRPPASRRRFGWRHIFLVFALVALSGGLLLVASFRMGGEARQLARAIQDLAPAAYQRQIEIGAGRLPLLVARAGLDFLPIEPEFRAALTSLRSADVGVYRRRTQALPITPQDLDQSIQSLMQRRGWIPMVRVVDGSQQVAVFVTESPNLLGETPLCVVVADDADLIVLSARIQPTPLIDALARRGRQTWDRLGIQL